jgi:hypothetical protein
VANSPLEYTLEAYARGRYSIPVPFGTKGEQGLPIEWQNLRLTATELPRYFNSERMNVGQLPGVAPEGFTPTNIVDLDAAEVQAVADYVLTPTASEHGRASSPRSHREYRVDPPLPTKQFQDPLEPKDGSRGMLVELLGPKRQMVAYGQHPSGEWYRWDSDGEPSWADGQDLYDRVSRLAAIGLLIRYWPGEGKRHDSANALAGGLLRAGWPVERTSWLIELVATAAGDEQTAARVKDAGYTASRLEQGGPATGWPKLATLLDPRVVDKVREWLDVQSSAPAGVAHVTRVEAPWPQPLAEEAFYGLAGDIVRAIEPYSEADLAALLGHVLVEVGALVGPRVHAIAGDALHPARLNAVCVGETSKGRKGSAARPVERLLGMVDAELAPGHVVEGLSSGEGLIWQVRDPIERPERTGRGAERRTELVEVDPGVEDKRLLVIESEFASALRVIQREGNTLSAVVRRAWDSGDLRTLTKNSPAVATGAHIGIVGHVTKDELLRYLDRTELASGFANRFLWLAVRRRQPLPDGERVAEAAFAPLVKKLRAVYDWAQTHRILRRDAEASGIWHHIYEHLSEGRPGLYGAATNRAEAQVLRISVLYAILDRAEQIRVPHLTAALAVWRYADQSARWIFGDSTGDPNADTILAALRASGPLDRNSLVDFFGRNLNRSRMDHALGLLLQAGLARVERQETGGRPREVWYAT